MTYPAAYLANRFPHPALNKQSSLKRLNDVELDLSHLSVIGARAFVNIETPTKKLGAKAFEAAMVRYAFHSKGGRLWEANRRIVERRNLVFIEIPEVKLLPVASESAGIDFRANSAWGGKSGYNTEGDFLDDVRLYISTVDFRLFPTINVYAPVHRIKRTDDPQLLKLFQSLSTGAADSGSVPTGAGAGADSCPKDVTDER